MQITFTYKNHRAEVEERTVDFIGLVYDRDPPFGYQPGWFLNGFCHTKQATRSFALSHIQLDLSKRFFWVVR